jgi:GntR family transcriptional regulator
VYLQLVDQIRQQVSAGDLLPGDQLPTVRQLAAELRLNFNTIARAYRILDEAGLISTQQGRGTYISEETPPGVLAEIRQRSLEELTRAYLGEARQLGFSAEDIRQQIGEIIRAESSENKKGEK